MAIAHCAHSSPLSIHTNPLFSSDQPLTHCHSLSLLVPSFIVHAHTHTQKEKFPFSMLFSFFFLLYHFPFSLSWQC